MLLHNILDAPLFPEVWAVCARRFPLMCPHKWMEFLQKDAAQETFFPLLFFF